MRKNLFILVLIGLLNMHAHGQCNIVPSSTKACLGSSITFTPNPVTANDSAFAWNFGNGNTSVQSNPTYQYPAAGTFTVSLRIYRKGGSFCDATPVQVRVFHKPIANFSINPNDSLCYSGHQFTFNDLSTPGLSNAPLIRRTFLYGDGGFVQHNTPFPVIPKHSYPNGAGGKYQVVVEVEDTNGCVSQKVDSVVVFPRIEPLFVFSQDIRCNQTFVEFFNQSLVDLQGLKVRWYFGDGKYTDGDSAKMGVKHTYTGNGLYIPSFSITDRFGCRDTFVSSIPVETFTLDSTIYIASKSKSCYLQHQFTFSNNTKLGLFRWTIKDSFNHKVADTVLKSYKTAFASCGVYNVRLDYNYNGCTFQTDTQVMVYGPQAVMENDSIAPVQWIQCGAHDTVVFMRPDVNCYYKNTNLKYFWDFDDAFAPPCTTDTRKGVNAGINCRYSLDSGNVKHFYNQIDPLCHNPRMWIADTVLGCSDTDYVFLRLGYPDAGWDSTAIPIRYGAYAEDPGTCSRTNGNVIFHFDKLLPACGPEKVWLLPDTNCAVKNWIPVDSLGRKLVYTHPVAGLCGNFEHLVFGLVARNGKDALGNYCYDTAYYPYKIKEASKPVFAFNFVDTNLCAPHLFRISPVDSVRKDIDQLIYGFGDNSPDVVVNLNTNGTDTIIPVIDHVYQADGAYQISVFYKSKNGCTGIVLHNFEIGELIELINDKPRVCNGDEAAFYVNVFYRTKPGVYYWNDLNRSDAGKEQLYWNFGDDNTWVRSTGIMKHKYQLPGTYQVTLAYKDSSINGCFDTLAHPSMQVVVTSVKARIGLENDTFYCAPAIIGFRDSSYAYYGDTIKRPQLVNQWNWTFERNQSTSTLKDPGVFYGENGVFKARLYVESVYGCADTTSIPFVILGPEPRFVIVGDTGGCAPFTVKLKNNTGKQLKSWIWYFNDPLNTIYSTTQDTDVFFTYTTPGIYPIDLLGEDSIYNPTTGNYKSCSLKYPYLGSGATHPFRVEVLAYDTLRINCPDTICPDAPFQATVSGTNRVNTVDWFWGDSFSALNQPIADTQTHDYTAAGLYEIEAIPVGATPELCVVKAQKKIQVLQPNADFIFDASNYPTVNFTNTSGGASRYEWDFGQPGEPGNTSTEVNPVYDFGSGNKYYTVCLSAFNNAGCWDSVCKIMPIRSGVKIPNVFTPSNGDGYNDAFDIEIEGWEKYELFIYNRWGTLVFEGNKDGFRNDGINWNGKNKNDGNPCPEGTYFVIFNYKLLTEPKEVTYRGTVTLIRD